jgi:hypothetical protein
MIENSSYTPISEFEGSCYDTLVFAVGSEVRSIQLFEIFGSLPLRAAAYIHNHSSFLKERAGKAVENRSIDFEIVGGSIFANGQSSAFRSFLSSSRSILVDVSCMSRTMMAELVLCLSEKRGAGCRVDFAYLPSIYSDPKMEYPKIRRIGAAAPQFSGFEFRPGDPVALVLGLGHEYGVSLGLMNQIEPRISVVFRSVGIDDRFSQAMAEANFDFQFPPFNPALVDVDVTDPDVAFGVVESTIANLISDHRVLVIPGGPKIFAILAILSAFKHIGKAAIYRVDHSRHFSLGLPSHSVVLFSMSEEFRPRKGQDEWFKW